MDLLVVLVGFYWHPSYFSWTLNPAETLFIFHHMMALQSLQLTFPPPHTHTHTIHWYFSPADKQGVKSRGASFQWLLSDWWKVDRINMAAIKKKFTKAGGFDFLCYYFRRPLISLAGMSPTMWGWIEGWWGESRRRAQVHCDKGIEITHKIRIQIPFDQGCSKWG